MMNEFDMMQDIERVLVPEDEIHARIREVGAQISEDYRGKKPILVFRGNGAGHHHPGAGGFHVRHLL